MGTPGPANCACCSALNVDTEFITMPSMRFSSSEWTYCICLPASRSLLQSTRSQARLSAASRCRRRTRARMPPASQSRTRREPIHFRRFAPGTYTLRAGKPGFKSVVRSQIELQVQQAGASTLNCRWDSQRVDRSTRRCGGARDRQRDGFPDCRAALQWDGAFPRLTFPTIRALGTVPTARS
jgi:hypothetical protein